MTTHSTWSPESIEIFDKTYDEGSHLDADQIQLRCKNCGALDSLVENTMVPRSMGAWLYRDPQGRYIVDLSTASDEAYWEAEVDHKWGCQNCVSEGEYIHDIFEIVPDDDES